jgi:ribonuclease Z
VATHFPVADDTVACALNSVQAHCPDVELGKNIVWSFDLMVIKVTKERITQLRGEVSDYGFSPTANLPHGQANTPKYNDGNGKGDPYAQINTSTEIPACGANTCNYREVGYCLSPSALAQRAIRGASLRSSFPYGQRSVQGPSRRRALVQQ